MITIQDVEDAQERWGQGIVEISSAYDEGGDFVKESQNYTLIHFMITKMVASYSSLHLRKRGAVSFDIRISPFLLCG